MSQVLADFRAGGGIVSSVVGGANISVVTVAGVATVSVSGTTQYAVQVGNGGALFSLPIGTAGQVLTSNGAGSNPSFQSFNANRFLSGNSGGMVAPDGVGNTNVVGDGTTINVVGNPVTHTLTISAIGGVTPVESFKGNDGVQEYPDGSGIFNIVTANATAKFLGSANTETLNFGITNLLLGSNGAIAGAIQNVGYGSGALGLLTTGNSNTAVGFNSLAALTTNSSNVAVGFNALTACTSDSNVAIGFGAAGSLTTGNLTVAIGKQALLNTNGTSNVAIGNNAGGLLTSGATNTILGGGSLANCLTGSGNLVLGYQTGGNLIGAESNNIILSNGGLVGQSGTIVIGTAATHTSCYIAGIDGVNVGSVAKVVTEVSGQLGSATITAGTGTSIVPTANTITINAVGGGVTWTVIAVNQTAAVNNGYFCNKAGTLAIALPAVSAVGDTIKVININTALGVQFTQAANQQIFISSVSTTLGATGTLTSSVVGDTLTLVCSVANLTWWAEDFVGAWTTA